MHMVLIFCKIRNICWEMTHAHTAFTLLSENKRITCFQQPPQLIESFNLRLEFIVFSIMFGYYFSNSISKPAHSTIFYSYLGWLILNISGLRNFEWKRHPSFSFTVFAILLFNLCNPSFNWYQCKIKMNSLQFNAVLLL